MSAAPTADPNAAQRDYWNSEVAQKWAINAAVLDAAFAALTVRIVELAVLGPGERVLDLGCGAGATTLAAARAVGPDGEVVGLDLSEPLVALATERLRAAGAVHARVALADAQTEPLPEARYHAALSRFGVMFFADPVAAFGNVRRALAPGGRVVFAAWASLDGNPWFDLPRRAAIDRLGPVVPSAPREPGPMAFAEADYFAAVLSLAGFADVAIRDEMLPLVHSGPVEETARLMSTLGPAVRIIRERGGTEDDAAAIVAAIAADLAPQVDETGSVAVPARLNLALARRP